MITPHYHALAVAGVDLANRLLAKARKPGAGGRTATAVLTYPAPDLDGDFVRPDGGRWAARPFVNWNHDIPVGTGRVVLKALEDGGATHVVPVGTTRFAERASDLAGVSRVRRDPETNKPVGTYPLDECLRAAADVWELVDREVATGVSIEFVPAGPRGEAYWPLPGRSAVSGRPSYHFERWDGLGWAHAPEPINRSAGLVIDDLPAVGKALRIAETGRFPSGRQITETVRKAFDPLLSLPRRVVAAGGWAGGPRDQTTPQPVVEKAMDEPVVPETPPADAAPPPAGGLKPTARAVMTVVQGIYDLCQQADGLLSGSDLEHERGIALLRSAIDKLKAEAGKIHDKAAATFPDQGLERPDDESDDEDDAADDADVDEADDAEAGADELEDDDDDVGAADYPEMTGDGAVVTKAFPAGIPGIQRFKLSQLKDIPARPAAGDDAVDPAVAALLRKTHADLAKLLKRQRAQAAKIADLA